MKTKLAILAALAALGALVPAPSGSAALEPGASTSSVPQTAPLVAVVGGTVSVAGVTTVISVYVPTGPRFEGEYVDFAVAPGARILVDDARLFRFDGRSICSLLLLTVRMRPNPVVTHAELLTHENQCLRNFLRAGRAMPAAEARAEVRRHLRWVDRKRRSETRLRRS